ncbi:hypothetical protein K2W90_00610 [Candidatus Babeliales bacterium]|nr:hypothetical protein [Candidatus Babeliales bacterium]
MTKRMLRLVLACVVMISCAQVYGAAGQFGSDDEAYYQEVQLEEDGQQAQDQQEEGPGLWGSIVAGASGLWERLTMPAPEQPAPKALLDQADENAPLPDEIHLQDNCSRSNCPLYFQKGDVIAILACGHVFCTPCANEILAWNAEKKCPICQAGPFAKYFPSRGL